jgi:hypothetical protein
MSCGLKVRVELKGRVALKFGKLPLLENLRVKEFCITMLAAIAQAPITDTTVANSKALKWDRDCFCVDFFSSLKPITPQDQLCLLCDLQSEVCRKANVKRQF